VSMDRFHSARAVRVAGSKVSQLTPGLLLPTWVGTNLFGFGIYRQDDENGNWIVSGTARAALHAAAADNDATSGNQDIASVLEKVPGARRGVWSRPRYASGRSWKMHWRCHNREWRPGYLRNTLLMWQWRFFPLRPASRHLHFSPAPHYGSWS
jgi:hypothetical protein